MANQVYLKILKRGGEAWNRWRLKNPGVRPSLSGADLHKAMLFRADLRLLDLKGANLTGAFLRWADLGAADLSRAILIGASLTMAGLRGADLRRASFRGADLRLADFSAAKLSGADLTDAVIWLTTFGNTDLSEVMGLETVRHFGPSTIGIDTIYRSKGDIPEVFLRGCGVPEEFIVYMKSLVGKPIDFYSCFMSYSTRDDDFTQRLYADLQGKNVRCWKFSEDAKWGETVWGEIDRSVRIYDKLVVVCSEASHQSQPVIREIERALQKEDRENKNVLFPVRIDDYLFKKWDHPRKADVVSKVVGDFRGWENIKEYSKAFTKFLDALNRPQGPQKNNK